ncbi:MAG: hypothetical protein M3P93_09795 [Actinomycetota bacterium]|nr:hypothetical protein [Actinomycetota bacterium]
MQLASFGCQLERRAAAVRPQDGEVHISALYPKTRAAEIDAAKEAR